MSPNSSSLPRLPKLTVIVPCRNEERFIAACLDSILQNDYPVDRLEIIAVDGMSSDATWEIIKIYVGQFPLIIPLLNDRRITPVALNLAIRVASGEVICRVDAHARIAPDYLRRCVELLISSGAQNVGGAMRTLPADSSLAAKCIALCMSHRFGVGNSEFRAGSNVKPILTDTVFGGCYRKTLFASIGMFNENLPRSQDFEFNQRIRRSGAKIVLDPAIKCDYFAAPNLKTFASHNFHDGVWAILPFAHSNVMPVRIRHLAAFLALLTFAFLAVSGIWFPGARFALLALTLVYLAMSLTFSLRLARQHRNARCFFTTPLVFAIRHFAYGLGSVCGAARLLFSGSLTRALSHFSPLRKARSRAPRLRAES